MLKGNGLYEGIVIAKAVMKKEKKIEIVRDRVDDVEFEIERLNDAVYRYTNYLERTYNKTLNILGEDEATIHRNHLNVIKDSVMMGGVRKQIRDKGINAEFVLDDVKNKYEAIYNRMDDDFLKKKAEYIRNITEGIILHLNDSDTASFDEIEEPAIIVASTLDASDTIDIEKEKVLGIVLGEVDATSHGAMLAKNWKIPCVIGIKNLMELVRENDTLVLDGKKGEIQVNPDEGTIKSVNDKLNKVEELDGIYQNYIEKPTQTVDGHRLDLNSIVSKPDEVRFAVRNGADHIGLYRTEALFIGRQSMPSEEEQFKVYQEAVSYSRGKSLCFRTFDCSGKSDLPYLHLPEENNPALGFFSTRIALANKEMLIIQVKAILRAGVDGDVTFVIPMVSSVDELLDIKLLIEDAKLMLEEEGKPFKKDMQYGIILETPSVAIITNFFAQEVDFIYVDVDDMLQYSTATDPTNEMISNLYDEFDPGYLRILRAMIRSSHREGASICFAGERCANELMAPVFMAMGVDRLCMPYKDVPKVRWEINTTGKKVWEDILDEISNMASGKQIKAYLEKSFGEEILYKE